MRCQSSDECVTAVTMPETVPADANVVGPYCKPWGSYSSCVECRTNEDCTHSPHGPRCNVATGFCACCDDAECPDPYVCPQGSFACE